MEIRFDPVVTGKLYPRERTLPILRFRDDNIQSTFEISYTFCLFIFFYFVFHTLFEVDNIRINVENARKKKKLYIIESLKMSYKERKKGERI